MSGTELVILLFTKCALVVFFREINYSIGAQRSYLRMQIYLIKSSEVK